MVQMKRNLKKLALNLPKTSIGKPLEKEEKPHNYHSGPVCILPNLYLGAYHNATNPAQLDQHQINCIINVASEVTMPSLPSSITYHHLKWTHCQRNLAQSEFPYAIHLIQQAHRQHQTVLIHCQQGIERSAALIMAFLIHASKTKGSLWTLDQTLTFVKTKAPGIHPNMELLYQLREYERSLSTQTRRRTRRSGSVSDCTETLAIQKKRQRSISCRGSIDLYYLADTKRKRVLAVTSTLVVLAAMYQKQQSEVVDLYLGRPFNVPIKKHVFPVS